MEGEIELSRPLSSFLFALRERERVMREREGERERVMRERERERACGGKQGSKAI